MKRTLDVVLGGALLLCLSPVYLVIALLIKLSSRGPVLFRQQRRGIGTTTFELLKFRTMVVDAESRLSEVMHLNVHEAAGDGRMYKIAGDPRVTRIGRILRRHCLDEIPQLWNVIRGEMSLVGPRPLILSEDGVVDEGHSARREVRPGLTGPWQVGGRNRLTFEQMLALDCEYARRNTLTGDLWLLARTGPVVFGAQDDY